MSKKSSTFAPAFEKKTTGAVVQLVRIPACHAVGREFESRPHRKRLRPLFFSKEKGPLAQLNRVPHYGCGGCRFESCMDHKNNRQSSGLQSLGDYSFRFYILLHHLSAIFFNSFVCGLLGMPFLLAGHLGCPVFIASNVPSRQYLIPYASSGITTVLIIEMVSVPAEGVAQFRSAC